MNLAPLPLAFRLIRVPGIQALSRLLLRRTLSKKGHLLPEEVPDEVESFFVHDLIGNIDTDDDGKVDSFRLAVTNAWFNQQITGITLTVNGCNFPPEKILVDNDFAQSRGHMIRKLRFVPGHPFKIIAEGKKLGRGLNFIGLTLHAELVDMKIPVIPIIMKGNAGTVPLLKPEWDPEMQVAFEPDDKATIHLCPHIHYDFEWLLTNDRFSPVAVSNLEEAVSILKANSEATFAVDQTPQLAALAEKSPEVFSELVEMVKSGRIEAMLGGYVEPDTNLPSGESLVRQFVRWQQYAMETFGKYSSTAWLIDSFGMNGQLPQILRKCAAKSLVFTRRLPQDTAVQSDFSWLGIDGTPIDTHHLSHFYFAGYPIDVDEKRAEYKLFRAFQRLKSASDQDALFCPSGTDHGRPQAHAPQRIRDWNRNHTNVQFQYSTPEQYFQAVETEHFASFQGELQGSMPGVNAARIELKKLNRKAEAALLCAESLAAVQTIVGQQPQIKALDVAWKGVLESHFHDSITGCNTDEVAADIRRRLEQGEELGRRVGDRILTILADRVAAAAGNNPYVFIFNPTSYARREVVDIDLPAVDGKFPYLTDGKRFVPYQATKVERYPDGTGKRVRACFLSNLPPFGYRVYYLVSEGQYHKPTIFAPVEAGEDSLENGSIYVRFSLKDGSIRYVVEKETERLWQLRGAAGLSLRRDRGTLYQEMQSGCFKKAKNVRTRVVEYGPIRGVWEASGAIGNSNFTTTYTLWAGTSQVRVHTQVDFNDPGMALFANVSNDPYKFDLRAEIPFGSIPRGEGSGIAQNYLHIHFDNNRSLTVLNKGVPGYHNLGKKGVKLALHRSVDKIHFYDSGHGALGIGRSEFEYALRFCDGDILAAKPWRFGEVFNRPIQVVQRLGEAGEQKQRPKALRHSFGFFEQENIVITSLRPTEDGALEMRCYEALGELTHATFMAGYTIEIAQLTDMLGRIADTIETDGRSMILAFRPYEIKTLKIRPGQKAPQPVPDKD